MKKIKTFDVNYKKSSKEIVEVPTIGRPRMVEYFNWNSELTAATLRFHMEIESDMDFEASTKFLVIRERIDFEDHDTIYWLSIKTPIGVLYIYEVLDDVDPDV